MAPRPLKQVRPSAVINTVGEYAAFQARNVSLQAARCIAAWATVELGAAGALIEVLGANARPAIAMLSALTSSQAQNAAIEAAAAAVLPKQQIDVFRATLQVVRRRGKKRNRLAHWVWAYSNDLPDHLLLIEPDRYIDVILSNKEDVNAARQEPGKFRMLEGVWVYTVADMIELRNLFQMTGYLMNFLRRIAHPEPDIAEQAMNRLSREPEIRKVLARQDRKPRTTPEAQP